MGEMETKRIVEWLREVYGEKEAVIAVSGGVDSALALTLLVKALGKEKVTPICLPYKNQNMDDARAIIEWNGLRDRAIEINIGEHVESLAGTLGVQEGSLRKGNIMARVRMIVVFDFAKKANALVCGTENKSEYLLGYYTRFGDSASDVEPISSLYKTEVWAMAQYLGLPKIFYTKKPSAELWEGQSDEDEMGFSYLEADCVLQGKIAGVDQAVVDRVRKVVAANKFKQEVPYQQSV